MGLYEDLRELKERLDRLLPPVPPVASGEDEREFQPGRDMLIEAEPVSVTRLALDPKHWRLLPGYIPSVHDGSRESRQWYARRATQHGSTWGDNEPDSAASVPTGMRLWHASERARQLLVHARHDLDALFDYGTAPGLPRHEDTLLVTPRQMLGYRDGLALLTPSSPYLAKLCREYARMACHLYGVLLEEFAMLTKMCVRRHVYPLTPIMLQPTGGGVYDSGPVISVHVGVPQAAHELSPSLMPACAGDPSVRVVVPEGVMVVLDIYARMSYGRGYAHAPGGPTVFYTLEFYMDSMRETSYITRQPITGALIMYTPIVKQHAVQRSRGWEQEGRRLDTCAKRQVVRSMRARLQDTESHLLSTKGHGAVSRGENSPSNIMAE
jgi:hypothetical protein